MKEGQKFLCYSKTYYGPVVVQGGNLVRCDYKPGAIVNQRDAFYLRPIRY